jgi:hypothetical protein
MDMTSKTQEVVRIRNYYSQSKGLSPRRRLRTSARVALIASSIAFFLIGAIALFVLFFFVPH